MADQVNLNNDLGDLSSALNTDSVIDLNWLDLTNGDDYDNIPSDSERKIIPQFQKQWNTEQYSSPYRLIPNVVAPGATPGKEKSIKEEDLFDVARVAKKAMMQGMKGPEVLSQLRDRYDYGTLEAATPLLKKVASEEGLLGNVYIDLSPFRTTKEAANILGNTRVRLASFVVGSPMFEENFVDSFGNCKNLKKAAVAEVPYTKEVLAHYETHLKNSGRLASDAKIETKEQLKLAFLTEKKAESLVGPEHHVDTPEPINEDNVQQAMASIAANKAAAVRSASEIRLAQARPILAKVQDLMLKGLMGDQLKDGIKGALPSNTIADFAPEISGLVKKQGLIGPVVIDVSAYPNVDDASNAVSKSFMKPKFIVKTMDTKPGFMDSVSTRTGLPILSNDNREAFDAKVAQEVISTLTASAKIDNKVAEALALEADKNPAGTVINAMLASNEKKSSKQPVRMAANMPQASVFTSEASVQPTADVGAIKTAATTSIEKGLSINAISDKIAGMLPLQEAMSIVKEAIASMSEVQASSMDSCQTRSYPLSKSASIIPTEKCASCVKQAYGNCTGQGRPMVLGKGRGKGKGLGEVKNLAAEFGIQDGGIILDINDVVTPPKKSIDINLEGLNGLMM